MTDRWFAFCTQASREVKARDALIWAGVPCFVARELREVRRHRHARHQTSTRKVPLLPGYVLCCYEGDEPLANWFARVFATTMYGGAMQGHVRAVRSVIGTGVAAQIPDANVVRLSGMDGKAPPKPTPVQFKIGGTVIATAGIVENMSFTVEAITDAEVMVLFGLTKLFIPKNQLRAA